LKAEGEIELEAIKLVANKAIEFHDHQRKQLAAYIINFLGKSLNADK
jgi:hypothetical protein